MKLEMSLTRMSRDLSLLSLIVFACFTAGRAEVIPRACVNTTFQSGTTTLAANVGAGATQIAVNTGIPQFVALVINPGGMNEERVPYSAYESPLTIKLARTFTSALLGANANLTQYTLVNAHTAGEAITFEGYSGTAAIGYNNTSSSTVSIPRGVSSHNFFSPGPLVYSSQPTLFLPGIHDFVFSIRFGGLPSDAVTWYLDGNEISFRNVGGQGCPTITYQGRLSDGSAAANGLYDLQFTAYDALTGGTAQTESLIIDDVQVTSGIFTVSLAFGSSITNNNNFKFFEIRVRPGADTGPFTILTPRQPITDVPFAVNAQNAQNALTATTATNSTTATNATQLGGVAANQYVLTTDPRLSATNNTNFIQNSTTQQTGNFNINGNGTVGGSLTVTGAINGTVTNATQLGGLAANQYLRLSGGTISGNLQLTGDGGIGNNLIVTNNGTVGGNLTVGGNANFTGTLTNGCRAGFTAFAGGRLCVSGMQATATFYGGSGAIQTCANMQARVGNSADVMLTFSNTGFNYFTGASQGWLADHFADNTWGTWLTPSVTPDFDGTPLNVYNGNGGSPPTLPYRCVY